MTLDNDFKDTHPGKLQTTETYKPCNTYLKYFINKLLFTICMVNLVDANILTLQLFTKFAVTYKQGFNTLQIFIFSLILFLPSEFLVLLLQKSIAFQLLTKQYKST